MAQYKMLVGIIVYYDIGIEADSVEHAKNKMNNAFSTMDGYWNDEINRAIGTSIDKRHQSEVYHGIKDGSIREIKETVVG